MHFLEVVTHTDEQIAPTKIAPSVLSRAGSEVDMLGEGQGTRWQARVCNCPVWFYVSWMACFGAPRLRRSPSTEMNGVVYVTYVS